MSTRLRERDWGEFVNSRFITRDGELTFEVVRLTDVSRAKDAAGDGVLGQQIPREGDGIYLVVKHAGTGSLIAMVGTEEEAAEYPVHTLVRHPKVAPKPTLVEFDTASLAALSYGKAERVAKALGLLAGEQFLDGWRRARSEYAIAA